jgi:hypothetical protein
MGHTNARRRGGYAETIIDVEEVEEEDNKGKKIAMSGKEVPQAPAGHRNNPYMVVCEPETDVQLTTHKRDLDTREIRIRMRENALSKSEAEMGAVREKLDRKKMELEEKELRLRRMEVKLDMRQERINRFEMDLHEKFAPVPSRSVFDIAAQRRARHFGGSERGPNRFEFGPIKKDARSWGDDMGRSMC